jgi:predicted RNase H-like HicB family nuclease
MQIEIEREEDGRWLTEIPGLPGVMAYGQTQAEAVAKVKALALRVMADRLEHGKTIPGLNEAASKLLTAPFAECFRREDPSGGFYSQNCFRFPRFIHGEDS